MEEVKMKRCTRCGNFYPVSEFNKNKATKDGLSCYCRGCQSQYLKDLRAMKRREIALKLSYNENVIPQGTK